MDSDFDFKVSGERTYQRQLQDGNNTRVRDMRVYMGNSLSLSAARPTPAYKNKTNAGRGSCFLRVGEKKIHQDMEIHGVIDYKILETKYQYDKNRLPSSVCLNPKQKLNHQLHTQVKRKEFGKVPKPRVVNLNKIHPNLYLGNADYLSSDHHLDTKFSTIINCSRLNLWGFGNESMWKFPKNGPDVRKRQVYSIDYEDNRCIRFPDFKAIIGRTNQLLDEHLDQGKVLVVCDQGVNRSVSIVIAYAILCQGLTYSQVLDFVEEAKFEYDPNWNNLSNAKIRQFLKILIPLKSDMQVDSQQRC
jgi:hypothetical protein